MDTWPMRAWPLAVAQIRAFDRPQAGPAGGRESKETRISERFECVLRLLAAGSGLPTAAYCPMTDGHFGRIQWVGACEPPTRSLLALMHRTAVQPDILAVEDARSEAAPDPETSESPPSVVGHFAGVAIRSRNGHVLGVLCVMSDEAGALTERTRACLADARSIMEREAVLRRQAARDVLTGLRNRRSVEAQLEHEWRRAVRERSCLSVLSFDVDYFKGFNDHYGHPAGDAALREVAKVLSRSLKRPADFVGRIGGEEFLACLPRTDAAGALMASELIRLAVERLGIPHAKSPMGCVTVSIGAVSVGGGGIAMLEPLGLIELADSALYRAKERGRNCVAFIDQSDFDPMHDVVAPPFAAAHT